MSEIRFSYNPFTKDFIESSTSHSIAIANKGKQKQFDEYIRGIILDGVLYLRLYYPFNDLDNLSLVELKQKSRELLEQYYIDILVALWVKKEFRPKEIKFNVDNDLLTGVGLANI